MGIATVGNVAETAYHQGIDLWGEHKERIIAAAEFHASLMYDEPAPFWQAAPHFLTCSGEGSTSRHSSNSSNSSTPRKSASMIYPPGGGVIASNGSTFELIFHHFHVRLGVAMPNVSALLPKIRPLSCWDHMCWETLTHGGNFSE
eukprot:COSAG01_NODE_965_length_12401_cov_3.496098_3_plen_145_part_00